MLTIVKNDVLSCLPFGILILYSCGLSVLEALRAVAVQTIRGFDVKKVFPPIHLSDGSGNWLRCSSESGKTQTVCGATADVLCTDCGPLCEQCKRNTPCISPDNQHRLALPVIDETRYPLVAVLNALKSRRVTVQNGIERLRALGAAEFLVDTVHAIESGRVCPVGDYSELLRDLGQVSGGAQ
jgi:hypothetical protein